MSIRPVSVTKDYDLISSFDSALALTPKPPEPERLPDETDDALDRRIEEWKAEKKKIVAENNAAYGRALESGDWKPILRDGETPTRFRVRQVPGHVWRTLDRIIAGKGMRENTLLVFRVGVVGIEDGPLGHRLELTEHLGDDGKPSGLGPVVSLTDCDALDAIPPKMEIVDEIGLLIMLQRTGGPG